MKCFFDKLLSTNQIYNIVFIIILPGIKLDIVKNTASTFAYKITIINPIAIVKFIYITCKAIFLALFTIRNYDRGLLELVLTYFRTIKTNNYSKLYLYCLIWLIKATHLPILCEKI